MASDRSLTGKCVMPMTPSRLRRMAWTKKAPHRRPSVQGVIGRELNEEPHDQEPLYMTTASPAPQLPDDVDVREEIRVRLEGESGINQAMIAREAGVSSATLSQWLAGSYGGNSKNVETKLKAWLQHQLERQASGGLPQGPDWIPTPSALKVIDTLRYAQLAPDMVVIYGGAGVSKTKAIERHKRTSPNVFVFTAHPASSGVGATLQGIAEAVGLREYSTVGAALFKAICTRLVNTGGLLVIDEAQHLSPLALDQVRSIYDSANVGIALVGNEQVYGRMTGGSSRAAYLDRLYSRIGKRTWLKRATEADIEAVAKAWAINDAACRRTIVEIGSKPGALRTLTKVLRLAASYAQAERRALCCEDVRAAWNELGAE